MQEIVTLIVHRSGQGRALGHGALLLSDAAFERLRRHATSHSNDRYLEIECVGGSTDLNAVLETIVSETGRVPQRDPFHWRTDEFTLRKRKVFTKADIEESNLLHLQGSHQCPQIPLADQLPDEALDMPKRKKLERLKVAADAFAGGPFVITESAVTEMQDAGLTGLSHLPVTVGGKPSSPPLFRLSSTVVLPRCRLPMKSNDRVTHENGDIDVVPFTGDYSRGCHFAMFAASHDGWQLSYLQADLPPLDSFDIAVTVERLGNSESRAFRYIVVSQRFRAFALARSWRWCKFKPVEIAKD